MSANARPNLYILGAQKSGTTALSTFLSQHTDICLVKGKEAHVFDDPDYVSASNKLSFAKRKYESLTKHYNKETYLCDATPITLYNPYFLQECIKFNPEAKYIVILRDPVERAVSHYQMSLRRNEETKSMLTAFIVEPWRLRQIKKQTSWPFVCKYRSASYLSRGCYRKQLDVLFKLVDRKKVLVITQDFLRKEHSASLKKVFHFLGVKDESASIMGESVFESEPKPQGLNAFLAKSYAWLYFFIRREGIPSEQLT